MAKDANVFARVDASLKEEAEGILSQLGMPMSNAINVFLNQVVLRRGLPFEVVLPSRAPIGACTTWARRFRNPERRGIYIG